MYVKYICYYYSQTFYFEISKDTKNYIITLSTIHVNNKTSLTYHVFLGETENVKLKLKKCFVAGTRTRVSQVKAEYPNQLDYEPGSKAEYPNQPDYDGFVECIV